MRYDRNELKQELKRWEMKADAIERARARAKGGKMTGEEMLDVPEAGRDAILREKIAEIDGEIERQTLEAFERGRDPKQRAKEAGREWREGDGY